MGTGYALAEFNRLHKKMNVIYHEYAKSVGLSDAAFWLMYSLHEHNSPRTQRDLCEEWCYAPQTINSALKILEEKGFIALLPAPENRKNKQVCLTESGEKLVKEKVVPLISAEERSFERMDESERKSMLETTRKHIAILAEEINKINVIGGQTIAMVVSRGRCRVRPVIER